MNSQIRINVRRNIFVACQKLTATLLVALAAVVAGQAKSVVCVDGCGTPFVNVHEGYTRVGLGASDVIAVGGSLSNCLAMVASGDMLTIIAHGTPGGFLWGGRTYYGFGNGAGRHPIPPGFNALNNVTVNFCSCYSSTAPSVRDGKSILDKLLAAMNGDRNNTGNTGTGFVNPAWACIELGISGGTRQQRAAARALLRQNAGAFLSLPPVNRTPAPAVDQRAAAQNGLNANGLGAVTVSLPGRVGNATRSGYLPPVDSATRPAGCLGIAGCQACNGDAGGCGLAGFAIVEEDSPAPDHVAPNWALRIIGPNSISLTVEAREAGLGSVTLREADNATVSIPTFTVGSKEAIIVTAEKHDLNRPSRVRLEIADNAGNITTVDPLVSTITLRHGRWMGQTFADVPEQNKFVSVHNGIMGVRRLDVSVNDRLFNLSGLANDEVRTIDVSSALRPGDGNTIDLVGFGRVGARATVLVSSDPDALGPPESVEPHGGLIWGHLIEEAAER